MAFCLLSAAFCRADEPSPLVTKLEAGRKQVVVAYGTSLTAGGAWVGQMKDVLDKRYPKGHRSYRKDIDTHYGMYRSVAKQKGLLLIDHYPNWKDLQKKDEKRFLEYVPDTIHPTATGCAKVVTPVILDALGFKKSAPQTFPATDQPF